MGHDVLSILLMAILAAFPIRNALHENLPAPALQRSNATGTPVGLVAPGECVQGVFVPRGPDLDEPPERFRYRRRETTCRRGWLQQLGIELPHRFRRTCQRGRAAIRLAWEPWLDPSKASDPTMRLATIAGGDHDEYITRWARAARDSCMPIFLRFGPEMNGDWRHGAKVLMGTIPATSRPLGATSTICSRRKGPRTSCGHGVRMCWPTGYNPLPGLYPGDQYVDWVGLSGFNWGTTNRLNTWKTFDEVYDETLAVVARITAQPVMLAEVASAETGGDKEAWITGMFASLPRAPRSRDSCGSTSTRKRTGASRAAPRLLSHTGLAWPMLATCPPRL